nr:hypothetical protein [uncultured Undibacterium sp.]
MATKRRKQKIPVSTRITFRLAKWKIWLYAYGIDPRRLARSGTLLAIVALGGYLHEAVFTWIQRQVPPATPGRAMSIFLFIFMGISPVSAALTGWLMHRLSLNQLFACSDAMLNIILQTISTRLKRLIFSIVWLDAPFSRLRRVANAGSGSQSMLWE